MSRPNNLKVYSRFDPPPSPSVSFEDASLTRQEFAKDADINNIMAKYAAGLPPSPPGARPPIFGDFSNVPDYQTALNLVIDAQERFASLPSQVRRRFDNDPAQLLAFLGDESNRAEAIELGLIDKPVDDAQPHAAELVDDGQSPKGAEDSSARA